MVVRIVVLLVLFLMILSIPSLSSEKLTLEECENAAIENSSVLQASALDILIAKYKHDESASNSLPKVFAGGSYNYISDVAEIEIPVPGSSPIEMGVNNSFEAKLGVTAPLYTGGQLKHQKNASFHNFKASIEDFKADSLIILYALRKAWFSSIGANSELEALLVSHQRVTRHFEEIKTNVNTGMASQENLILVELELTRINEAIAITQGQLSASRLQLGKITGKPGDEVIAEGNLEKSLIGKDHNLYNYQNRPELKSLSQYINSSRETQKSASGSLLPQVNANTAFIYGKPGVDAISNEWMGYAVLGIELSWTIWDFGSRNSRIWQARSNSVKLEHNKAELEKQLTNGLSQAKVNLEKAQSAYEFALNRVSLEQKRQKMLKSRYLNGNATETELLDGEDDLRNAEINARKALTRLRLAEVELLYIAGK